MNSERKLRQRAWYYTRVYADTKDVNTVYVLNVSYHKSTDGGKTFGNLSMHLMAIITIYGLHQKIQTA